MLATGGTIVHHRNKHDRVKSFDFSALPVAEPMQRSLAAVFAARCVRRWTVHTTASQAFDHVMRFAQFLAALERPPGDFDELTVAMVKRWRHSRSGRSGGHQDLVWTLRANATTLSEVGGDHLWAPDAHRVWLRTGRSLGETGLVAGACDYFGRLYRATLGRFGPDHPDTLTSRHYLAGDIVGAVAAFQELLADRVRVLGPDHFDTLTTRNNLARLRGQSGDTAGAAAAFEELLTDYLHTRLRPPQHPDHRPTGAGEDSLT